MSPVRLLFLTSGDNGSLLADAVARVGPEQGLDVHAEAVLLQRLGQVEGERERLEAAATRAGAVLFDIRDNRAAVEVLREVRGRRSEVVLVPLSGGAPHILSLARMGSLDLDALRDRGGGGPVDHRWVLRVQALAEGLGGLLPVGQLRHARNLLRVTRYWAAGGPDNLDNMLRLVLREYLGGTGPAPALPIEPPALRLQDPEGGRSFGSRSAWLAAHPPSPGRPVVAVLYYGGLHREASSRAAASLAAALRGRAEVLPVATDGIRGLEAVRRFLVGGPDLDALVDLTWFRLDGGPLGGDPDRTVAVLDQLDAPYLVPAVLYMRDLDAWARSAEGLSPVETYAAVVLPELDGAQGPIPVLGRRAGRVGGMDVAEPEILPERIERVAERVGGWIDLRRTPPVERRVALVVYDHPPGPGSAGNASYLDTRASLASIGRALARAGYHLGDLPDDPLGDLLECGVHNGGEGSGWQGERLSLEDYGRVWSALPVARRDAVTRRFGPPPGELLVDALGLRIPGRWYGHVFIGFQPSREPGAPDPEAAAHDRALPPHHQYLAFYAWLRARDFHAVVHVGTHGTVEFLPGKELGLSATCVPELVRGDAPQLYIYDLANPSEGAIARRRWSAVLLTHHQPDLVPAGLYGEYQDLRDRLERLQEVVEGRRADLWEEIQALAGSLGIEAPAPDHLDHELRELQVAAIPRGLHVFGRPKDGRSLVRYLAQLARRQVAGVCLEEVAVGAFGAEAARAAVDRWVHTLVADAALPGDLAGLLPRRVRRDLEAALLSLSADYLRDQELPALLRALDGRYLPPGPMGDPLRSPTVHPTGRNGCAFDPTRVPHPDAVDRGAALAEALLERHLAEHGTPLQSASLVLWGFETARTGGETLGQFLHLVGARLGRRRGWLPELEPIPVVELGRPRVDVHLLMCGFFRDMFPTLVRDVDLLVRRIAALDEPLDLNPVRAHVLTARASLGEELAAARLFGPAPGTYGTELTEVVARSEWSGSEELGEHFERAMAHAYGAHLHGESAPRALRAALARTEVVAQVVDGADYRLGDLDHYYEFLGGAARAVHNARGAAPRTWVGDSARREPRLCSPDEETRRFAVTRLLNPRWIEALLDHPLHGGRKIEDRVTNLVGLAGTIGVPADLFARVCARYVEDGEVFEQLRANNPHAAAGLVRRLAEADRRGMWQPSAATRSLLGRRFLEIDAELES